MKLPVSINCSLFNAAIAWNGRVGIGQYRKETARIVAERWDYLTPTEVRAIVDLTLLNAFVYENINFPVGEDDEIGGKKPWWWGRESRTLQDLRDWRCSYRHGNKPVKQYWIDRERKFRATEVMVRKYRRVLLAERIVA